MADTDITKENLSDDEPLGFTLPITALPDRLDKVLAGLLPDHSRSRLQSWIESGHVQANDQAAKIRQRVGPGDHITVWEQAAPEQSAFVPQPVRFEVIAQSPDYIVVNKPAGLVTHPGAGNWQGTLLNGLLYQFPELAHVPRAGIVHRLDKDTSGLLVVARHERAQTHLVRQLQARTVKREYIALVHGTLSGSGSVVEPIGRDPRVPVRMAVQNPVAPKEAITHYQATRRGISPEGQPVTLVSCRLETGRTHQIRVHLMSLGHPLVGDTLYGGRGLAGATRQLLHARALSFNDPADNQPVSFQAELAADFAAALERMTWQA
jgi:23S rRNA pseudouridine1911/1915/1917 synthase